MAAYAQVGAKLLPQASDHTQSPAPAGALVETVAFHTRTFTRTRTFANSARTRTVTETVTFAGTVASHR